MWFKLQWRGNVFEQGDASARGSKIVQGGKKIPGGKLPSYFPRLC